MYGTNYLNLLTLVRYRCLCEMCISWIYLAICIYNSIMFCLLVWQLCLVVLSFWQIKMMMMMLFVDKSRDLTTAIIVVTILLSVAIIALVVYVVMLRGKIKSGICVSYTAVSDSLSNYFETRFSVSHRKIATHTVASPQRGLEWTCPPNFCPMSFLRLTQIR